MATSEGTDPVQAIRDIIKDSESIKVFCTEASVPIGKSKTPEATFNDVSAAIGAETMPLFQKDYKEQLTTMIKQVAFRRNEHVHQAYMKDGKLLVTIVELMIRGEKQRSDDVMLDMVICIAEIDFNKQWVWRGWKAKKCEEVLLQRFKELKSDNAAKQNSL